MPQDSSNQGAYLMSQWSAHFKPAFSAASLDAFAKGFLQQQIRAPLTLAFPIPLPQTQTSPFIGIPTNSGTTPITYPPTSDLISNASSSSLASSSAVVTSTSAGGTGTHGTTTGGFTTGGGGTSTSEGGLSTAPGSGTSTGLSTVTTGGAGTPTVLTSGDYTSGTIIGGVTVTDTGDGCFACDDAGNIDILGIGCDEFDGTAVLCGITVRQRCPRDYDCNCNPEPACGTCQTYDYDCCYSDGTTYTLAGCCCAAP